VIRKQIYIKQRQQETIRGIAAARGVSEAEVIREAIDTQREQRHSQPPDPLAWKRALKLMRSLQQKRRISKSRSPRTWERADLYEDRLNRYGRRTR